MEILEGDFESEKDAWRAATMVPKEDAPLKVWKDRL